MQKADSRRGRGNEAFCGRGMACFVLLMLLSGGMANAQMSDPKTWVVAIEPKFMRPALAQPISRAERTVLAPGYMDGGTLRYFSTEEFASLTTGWEAFSRRARDNAQLALGKLKPIYTRDKKKVIEYAALKSDGPEVAATVLAPKFLDLFKDIFGSHLILAIPSRERVYVFPKLASTYQEHASMVIDEYRASLHPVSLEVFELDATGLKAIGIFEDAEEDGL